MLTVKSPNEALALIARSFHPTLPSEQVPLSEACGRILSDPVTASEYVPGFDRSTVDGYAVHAKDTFGCSESIPALLVLTGAVAMGEGAGACLEPGTCRYVPTGGAVPCGADAMVMIEHAEVFDPFTVGILRPAAPGENLIYRGDDTVPGQLLFPSGYLLNAHDIGALAAMGVTAVSVFRRPRVGILSTGDELVDAACPPAEGQIRNVNSPMLSALMRELGACPVDYGIVRDEETRMRRTLEQAAAECDAVLISGGSSVGIKDVTESVIGSMGELLFHGIAMKPGKPTILGRVRSKPVFGLPGHPVAAYFVSRIFVRAALAALTGRTLKPYTIPAVLTESVSANHGRAQYSGASLSLRDGRWYLRPIHGKSGLITGLAASDGYFCVPRDCEGYAQGDVVDVTLYRTD